MRKSRDEQIKQTIATTTIGRTKPDKFKGVAVPIKRTITSIAVKRIPTVGNWIDLISKVKDLRLLP